MTAIATATQPHSGIRYICCVILYFSNHFNLSVYVSSHYIVADATATAAAVISDYSLFSLFRQSTCRAHGCVCVYVLCAFFVRLLLRMHFAVVRVCVLANSAAFIWRIRTENNFSLSLAFIGSRAIFRFVSLLLITAHSLTPAAPFFSSSSAFCFSTTIRGTGNLCVWVRIYFFFFFYAFCLFC